MSRPLLLSSAPFAHGLEVGSHQKLMSRLSASLWTIRHRLWSVLVRIPVRL